jgi:hypothetical protein
LIESAYNNANSFNLKLKGGSGAEKTALTWGEGIGLKLGSPLKAAGDPTTTQFGTDLAGMYKNTTNGKIYLVYNGGGTIKKVELV